MLRIWVKNPAVPVEIPVPQTEGLELVWNNIANVPVADASSVSDWNTFFDLPDNGTPFTSVEVTGNTVKLIGGSDINLVFDLLGASVENYISQVIDNGSVVSIGEYIFNSCQNLVSVEFPLVENFIHTFPGCINLNTALVPNAKVINGGFYLCSALVDMDAPLCTSLLGEAFLGCISLETLYFPSMLTIGASVLNNLIFDDVIGATITLTIPSALMTCNGGSPDGDIQYLQANNTVTIITV